MTNNAKGRMIKKIIEVKNFVKNYGDVEAVKKY